MHIEKNLIYIDKHAMRLELYPHLEYVDSKKVPEQYLEQLQKEYSIIGQLVDFNSFTNVTGVPHYEIQSPNDFLKEVEKLKEDMKERALPLSLLDNISVGGDEYNGRHVFMKPNKDFPVLSILYLQNQKDYITKKSNSSVQYDYQYLLEKYEEKQKELSTCKDPKFVKEQLEPIKKELTKFKKKNKESLEELTNNEKLFNQYIDDIGLKSVYQDFENIPVKEVTKSIKPKKN